MLLIIIGLAVVAATIAVFWMCLPREGRVFRFANTEWEAYIGVAFTMSLALGFTMLVSGVIDIFG